MVEWCCPWRNCSEGVGWIRTWYGIRMAAPVRFAAFLKTTKHDRVKHWLAWKDIAADACADQWMMKVDEVVKFCTEEADFLSHIVANFWNFSCALQRAAFCGMRTAVGQWEENRTNGGQLRSRVANCQSICLMQSCKALSDEQFLTQTKNYKIKSKSTCSFMTLPRKNDLRYLMWSMHRREAFLRYKTTVFNLLATSHRSPSKSPSFTGGLMM